MPSSANSLKMNNYRKLLPELIKFKSISTDSAFKKDIKATAEWLEKLFSDAHFFILPTQAEAYGLAYCEANFGSR